MNATNGVGLKLQIRVRGASNGGQDEVTLYAISGLAPDDSCVVGCAGVNISGQKKWYFRWDRSGIQLDTPEDSYDSPQDALRAIAELKAKGI